MGPPLQMLPLMLPPMLPLMLPQSACLLLTEVCAASLSEDLLCHRTSLATPCRFPLPLLVQRVRAARCSSASLHASAFPLQTVVAVLPKFAEDSGSLSHIPRLS